MAADLVHTGKVASFDDERGYGTIHDETDGVERFFHCTAIADGTRTIAEGADVAFRIVPGRLGRWEASDVHRR